jgi:phenylalanyl-tRNA synthetase beta chain
MDVPLEAQARYLEALGCKLDTRGSDDWLVSAPSWRFDVSIEEDLVEEVARLHGYEHIVETVPAMYFVPQEKDSTYQRLRLLLAGFGLQESINYIFSSDAELARAAAPAARHRLVSPQGIERSVLRTALYPGLLNAAVQNRQLPSLALFEVGHVFLEQEYERLAILIRGPWVEGGWLPSQTSDFYVLKGVLEKLAATLGSNLGLEPVELPFLHPGVSAKVKWQGQTVGVMGRLHPEVAARFELDEIYLAELDLPLPGGALTFADYARQPHAERDLAVVIPQDVNYAAVKEQVVAAAGARLESIQPFDLYQGEKIPAGKRSIAVRLRFRHPERALRDEEVDTFVANIISSLSTSGYAIRDR